MSVHIYLVCKCMQFLCQILSLQIEVLRLIGGSWRAGRLRVMAISPQGRIGRLGACTDARQLQELL